MKTALINGVTGQDGAYLARLLMAKGYSRNREASIGDLTDATKLIRIVQETQPDEIYNLAAQSHVQVSFETLGYTANSDAVGTLRLLATRWAPEIPFERGLQHAYRCYKENLSAAVYV